MRRRRMRIDRSNSCLRQRKTTESNAERQYIDASKLDLIGRREGGWYTRTMERFEMPNISVEQWGRSS
jgi:hypothetical protein